MTVPHRPEEPPEIGDRGEQPITGLAEAADSGSAEDVNVSRLAAFSDGVFAIAATLLILDVHVPSPSEPVSNLFSRGWPTLLAVTLSFIVIGIAWMHHHNLFHHVRVASRALLTANLALLLFISALPLAAAVLGTHLSGHQQRLATVIYTISLGLVSACFVALWAILCHRPRLLQPGSYQLALTARRRALLGLGTYVAAVIVALLLPAAALALIGVLLCYYLVGRRAPTSRTSRPGSDPV